jgi:sigma-B regulation protein RsbU (phosphoserine phosphatase)
LHLEARNHGRALEETVRDLEESRETIRVKTLEEKRRREDELRLAQETQESLLPRSLPQFGNFQIHAFSSPTRYVGGDFYDFLRLVSGDWVGVLADVSGKGMPAALLSSMVLGALNTEIRAGSQPPDMLNRINRLLCEKSLPDQFVTLFLFLMSPSGAGQFISAGHNPAFLFRSLSGAVERLASEHFFLGMFDSASYESRQLQLNAGDILIVYSDGLPDAENEREEIFGEAKLLEIIRRTATAGSQCLRQAILEALETHTRGTPQTDDITFMLVERVA